MNVLNFIAEAKEPIQDIADTLLRPMGAEGVYARTGAYENVVQALDRFVTRLRDPRAEVFRFPPVMSRSQLEKSGYLGSFPNLLGCVCALHGTEDQVRGAVECFEEGGDWTKALSSADLVLSPAACYPIYPIAARRGPLPADGLLFDVASDCFRHEPSSNLDRLQSFRMREYVRIGTPEQIRAFRDDWMQRAHLIAEGLGLDGCEIAPANDPFFGRANQIMAVSQKQQQLKFELLVPIYSREKPTACMSFNYHRDHFGLVWGIEGGDGAAAHTGCVAFGMDRLALAMFRTHGVDVEAWPSEIRLELDV